MNGLSVSKTSMAVGIKASIPVLTNQTQRGRSLRLWIARLTRRSIRLS